MATTADNLQKAIAEVQGGQARSMRAAALKYGIPKSTLHDHLSGKVKKGWCWKSNSPNTL